MVTIRLFASLKDVTGVGSLALESNTETTPRAVFQNLVKQYPDLSRYEKHLLVAVNEEYARMDLPIRDGDEVAFFPPVSGG